MPVPPRFRTFQGCPKDARVQFADYGPAISVIDSASDLGAIVMAMSAELPVQTPAADRSKQIDWAWNDVLKISGDSVVLAVAALFLVILVAASVALPKSTLDTTVSGELWIGPFGP